MAKPHGKTLLGKEGGGQSQHWYDYVLSKQRIKRKKLWDGGSPQCQPGTFYVTAVSLLKKEEPK